MLSEVFGLAVLISYLQNTSKLVDRNYLLGLIFPFASSDSFVTKIDRTNQEDCDQQERLNTYKFFLLYDDFYPNPSICRLIASNLIKQGFDVTLKKHDYYSGKPNYEYYVKFSIFSSIVNSPYSRYTALCESLLIQFPKLHQEYRSVRKQYNNSPSKVHLEHLNALLISNSLVIPLFYIPSICLTKHEINPFVYKP